MVVVALTLGVALLRPAPAQDDERPLTGPAGPYRGRVVDSTTDQALPDTAVLLYWQKLDERDIPRTFAFRETLTGAQGEFLVDAAAIEGALPPRALVPRILAYKPGYTAFPRQMRHPPGAASDPFTAGGGVIRLGPATTQDDRIEAFNLFFAGLQAASISNMDLPATNRLLLDELRWFGVRPPGDPKK